MFGIELIKNDVSQIFLNPSNLLIPDNYKCFGYIITEDKKIADDIANFKMTQEEVE